jgi:hypothetical protein
MFIPDPDLDFFFPSRTPDPGIKKALLFPDKSTDVSEGKSLGQKNI